MLFCLLLRRRYLFYKPEKYASRLRNMTFDNFDFNFQHSLSVEYLKDLMELSFVVKRQSLLIFGKQGQEKPRPSQNGGKTSLDAPSFSKLNSYQRNHMILYHP